MAYSFKEFTSDGSTTVYLIDFPYLEEDHVKYYLDGTLQDDSERVFTTEYQITITAPAADSIIRFQRESSIETPLVDWESGAGVSALNLDTNTLQMLYVAQESADAGSIDLSDAEAFKDLAEAAADLAEQWAEEPEDSEVETGKYSALHHAAKALASYLSAVVAQTAAETAQTNAETAETNAETAETNAETAETGAETAQAKAEDWAEEDEDVEVETGKYSAKHWAEKANDNAASALQNVVEDTSPELGGTLICGTNSIANAQLVDIAYKTQNLGSISTATTLSYSSGELFLITIAGDLTLTFTSPPSSGRTGIMILEITNGGAYTITWPTSVEWDGGTAPSLQVSGVDIITFITRDAGTTWRAVRGWKEA